MVRVATLVGLTCWLSLISGCRCMPGIEKYHNTIDTVSDFDILWDRWYYPPWDASRAGRPDWCSSSWNRKICPCRCQQGVWHGYYDCQHYPPNHPYSYPSQAVPLVGVLSPPPNATHPEVMRTPEEPGEAVPAIPVPSLEPAPTPRPPRNDPPPPDAPENGSSKVKTERAWLPTSFRSNPSNDQSWLELE